MSPPTRQKAWAPSRAEGLHIKDIKTVLGFEVASWVADWGISNVFDTSASFPMSGAKDNRPSDTCFWGIPTTVAGTPSPEGLK